MTLTVTNNDPSLAIDSQRSSTPVGTSSLHGEAVEQDLRLFSLGDDDMVETTVDDLEQGQSTEVTITSAVDSATCGLDSNNNPTKVQEATSTTDTVSSIIPTLASITSCSNWNFSDEEASLLLATSECQTPELQNINIGPPISHSLCPTTGTTTTTIAPAPSNTGTGTVSSEAEFLAVVRFCIYIGKAAFRYGSPGSKVEVFLQRLMEDRFGFYLGMFRATQSELLCSVCEKEDDPPRTFLIAIEPGLNLHKLGLLADLVDRVVPCGPDAVSRLEALAQLKEIELAPDPWGKVPVFISFPFVGAGLSMVLGGSWCDVGIAAALAMICFSTIEYLPRWNVRFAQWIPLVTAFWVSTIATILQQTWLEGLHVTLVTLSAIAVLLPGYTVSMGIGELISNRIISGAANLIGGMVCLFWLVIGAWLGEAFGASITNKALATDPSTATTTTWDAVPTIWQALFIPMLCFSLIVAFQVSRRDMIWCFCHLVLTYLTFVVTGLVLASTLRDEHDATTTSGTNTTISTNSTSCLVDDNPPPLLGNNGKRNLQTYFSAVVCCLAANTWAIRTNRPNSILLVPALVFLVSGSIGFRGLLTLLTTEDEQDKNMGTSQFLQMIIVALLIVAGLMTGNTLVEPSSTL